MKEAAREVDLTRRCSFSKILKIINFIKVTRVLK